MEHDLALQEAHKKLQQVQVAVAIRHDLQSVVE